MLTLHWLTDASDFHEGNLSVPLCVIREHLALVLF